MEFNDESGEAMKLGDRVQKTTGDYRYNGVIVAKFKKLSGVERFVVENHDGMLFIFNENQLEAVKP